VFVGCASSSMFGVRQLRLRGCFSFPSWPWDGGPPCSREALLSRACCRVCARKGKRHAAPPAQHIRTKTGVRSEPTGSRPRRHCAGPVAPQKRMQARPTRSVEHCAHSIHATLVRTHILTSFSVVRAPCASPPLPSWRRVAWGAFFLRFGLRSCDRRFESNEPAHSPAREIELNLGKGQQTRGTQRERRRREGQGCSCRFVANGRSDCRRGMDRRRSLASLAFLGLLPVRETNAHVSSQCM
jgi:hypothetical protein